LTAGVVKPAQQLGGKGSVHHGSRIPDCSQSIEQAGHLPLSIVLWSVPLHSNAQYHGRFEGIGCNNGASMLQCLIRSNQAPCLLGEQF
jgi:hypothetical protein